MCQELVMNLLACNVPSGQVSNVIKVVSESCSQIPNFRIALLWTGSARRIAFCHQQIAEEMQVSENLTLPKMNSPSLTVKPWLMQQ